jgi:hypothetical protein
VADEAHGNVREGPAAEDRQQYSLSGFDLASPISGRLCAAAGTTAAIEADTA